MVCLVNKQPSELPVTCWFEANVRHDLKVRQRDIADEQITRRAVAGEYNTQKTGFSVQAPQGVILSDPTPTG